MDGDIPAPPMPPPPPPVASAPPITAERKQLLGSIEGFNKKGLKKTVTKDMSAPVTTRTVNQGVGEGPKRGTGAPPPSGGAGFNLLAITGGQMPQLKPVNKAAPRPVSQQPLQAKTVTVVQSNRPSPSGRVGGPTVAPSNSAPMNNPPFNPPAKKASLTPTGGLAKPVARGPSTPTNFGSPIKVTQATPVRASIPTKQSPVQAPSVKEPAPIKAPQAAPKPISQPAPQQVKPAEPSKRFTQADLSELDDLLSELETPMVVPPKSTPAPYVQPTSYSEPVVETPVQQPRYEEVRYSDNACAGCGQEITEGKYLEALGKRWHEDHFKCTQCRKNLPPNFYALENSPFCDSCYFSQFKCAKCGGTVQDKYVSSNGGVYHPDCLLEKCDKCSGTIRGGEISVRALGSVFHTQCFTCRSCSRPLSDEFYEKNNQPYCQNCANSESGTTEQYVSTGTSNKSCPGCRQSISGSYITIADQNWHEECFRCSECSKVLRMQSGGMSCRQKRDGSIICEDCYKSVGVGTCAACKGQLVGQYVEALDQKWHSHCLTCSSCHFQLGNTFYESNGQLICQNCSTKCSVCSKPMSGQYVLAFDKKYHHECFRCSRCSGRLGESFYESEGQPLCETCSM